MGGVVMIGANLQYGTIARNTLGNVAACGWYNDNVYCDIASNFDTLAEDMRLTVCSYVVDTEATPPGVVPRSCVTWQVDGSILVIIDDQLGTTTIYRCINFDDGFEEVTV